MSHLRTLSLSVALLAFACTPREHVADAAQGIGGGADVDVDVAALSLSIDYADLASLDDGVQTFVVSTTIPEGARFDSALVGETGMVAFEDPASSAWFGTLAIDDAPVVSGSVSALVWQDNFGLGRPFPAAPNHGGYPATLLPIGGATLSLTVTLSDFSDPPLGANTVTAGHVAGVLYLAPPVTDLPTP